MLKQFSAAKKVQSKSIPNKAVYRKFNGLSIKCVTPKGTGTTSFDVFCLKSVQGCRL